jgi:hypothetical protein
MPLRMSKPGALLDLVEMLELLHSLDFGTLEV